ncbi:FAD-dependent oxidoreductase [Nocardioides sambongensis]|uniref:FAD-dependent oxidoreductase n=1 Tax=Nocardioides sambongensis TaxID=2589074 RepID=UPI001E5A7DDB|nr:FAD-dependent oxidoreductase [Nocardioides sambongensis]
MTSARTGSTPAPDGPAWDHEVDLLVVGSGAAGMTTALTGALEGLDTLLVEKAQVYGGTTALSGGGVWVPNNHVLTAAGISDPEERVLEYLEHITGGSIAQARLAALVHEGPAMFEMFRDRTSDLRFRWCPGYPTTTRRHRAAVPRVAVSSARPSPSTASATWRPRSGATSSPCPADW